MPGSSSRMSSSTIVTSAGIISSAPSSKRLADFGDELAGRQPETQALAVGHLEPPRDEHEADQQQSTCRRGWRCDENLGLSSHGEIEQPGGIAEDGDAREPQRDQSEEDREAAHRSVQRFWRAADRTALWPSASGARAGRRGPRNAARPPPPGSRGPPRAALRSSAATCDCARLTMRRRAPATWRVP